MAELSDVFRELDPPPGGRAALTARLARRRRQRRVAWGLAVAAAATVLLWVPRPTAPPDLGWSADPTVAQWQGAAPAPGVVSLDPQVAVQAVPTRAPGVRYYRVDVLSAPAR